ncbi:hypothetical protein DFP72DRAFT_908930 [Ephemerocybe angulata]|uniref:Uncharacterized protein n=1 Tax=Ephemerocybe angulata TaxID=980116 RepID=A0A8H6HSF8_9AGAR|nr:hypothetical protein DFP72DRAFT_908930 [Tulosesus angulatus]
MKITFLAIVALSGFVASCLGKTTKGYIQIKAPTWEKGVNLTTLFDYYDGGILGSEADPTLEVQMDLDKAQSTDSDIEILNGFWSDMYRYLGVCARDRYSIEYWQPPYYPYFDFIYVQQTPDAQPKQKENSLTACYPNPLQELPFQASAIVSLIY